MTATGIHCIPLSTALSRYRFHGGIDGPMPNSWKLVLQGSCLLVLAVANHSSIARDGKLAVICHHKDFWHSIVADRLTI